METTKELDNIAEPLNQTRNGWLSIINLAEIKVSSFFYTGSPVLVQKQTIWAIHLDGILIG